MFLKERAKVGFYLNQKLMSCFYKYVPTDFPYLSAAYLYRKTKIGFAHCDTKTLQKLINADCV